MNGKSMEMSVTQMRKTTASERRKRRMAQTPPDYDYPQKMTPEAQFLVTVFLVGAAYEAEMSLVSMAAKLANHPLNEKRNRKKKSKKK